MKKICRTCKEEKELSEFYTKKNTKDGYRTECKKCALKKEKEYRKNKPNYSALKKQYDKKRYLNNKEKK